MPDAEVLRASGLCKTYRRAYLLSRTLKTEIPVLMGADLVAESGKIVGIIGKNGCGKTTLLKICAGLVASDSGTLTLGTVNLLEDRVNRCSLTGYAGASPRSFYWRLTGRQNLLFFGALQGMTRRQTRDAIAVLTVRLDLCEFIDKPVGTCSGGMKQLLSIARCLMTPKKVLLFDEPLHGLDGEKRNRVICEINRAARDLGSIVLVTAQRQGEIEDFTDKIFLIQDGKLSLDSSGDSRPVPDRGPEITRVPGTWLRQIGAYLERDIRISLSYPLAAGFTLVGATAALLIFFFLGKLIGNQESGLLTRYGGNYFSFAVVGIAFSKCLSTLLTAFQSSIRSEQLKGTFQIQLTMAIALPILAGGLSARALINGFFRLFLYLLLGCLFLGLHLKYTQWMWAIITLLLSFACYTGFGLIAGGLTLHLKRSIPVAYMVLLGSEILAGVYYPLGVLPGFAQSVARFIPLTHAVELLRLLLLPVQADPAVINRGIASLGLLALLLLPAGWLFFKASLKAAVKAGNLEEY